ncbi:hypothetical protein GCM10022200_29390 [Microbacterium awajiense]|uniref:Secreted protein n=1 Tax=Microbacterium awajiense TaxID=415214 RepID=A0ABP7AYC5_9MICO
MKRIAKAAGALAAAGALVLGVAAPASAAAYPGTVISDGRYIVKYETPKADLSFQVGCTSHSDTPYVAVFARKTGHTNRPITVSIEATGGKGWTDTGKYRGDAVLDKALGSTAYTSLAAYKADGSAWDTRPAGTMTVTLQQFNLDGSAFGEPQSFTYPRPAVNCASVGGAVL